MDLGLRGKTVVVTGSTAGIGLATATAFAREGARVVVNGRTQARVDKARAEISAKVPRADVIGVAADADWLRFFEMNVMSGVRLSRALLPGMIARGWGRIVFISSESALQIPSR
jgi:NAD(P)-dependent dehydrogenase (short-subunit alcohol dehydrogenase family)